MEKELSMQISQTGEHKTWEGTITFGSDDGDEWAGLRDILNAVKDQKIQELGTAYRDLSARIVIAMDETDGI
jgi:hypothetical protein